MFKKTALLFMTGLALAACSSVQPKVIQASSGSPNISMTVGLATQIEMPDEGRVQSIIVGNPALVTAEQAGDVVNLVGKGDGETNLIIRSRDEDNKVKVYQYHITIQKP